MRLVRWACASLMASWLVERIFLSRKYSFRICDARLLGRTSRAVSQVRVDEYYSMSKSGQAATVFAIRRKARDVVIAGLKSGAIDMAATLDVKIVWKGESLFYEGLPGELMAKL